MSYSNKMLTKSLRELADLEKSQLVEDVEHRLVTPPDTDSQELFSETLDAMKEIDKRRKQVRDINVGLY